MKAEGRSFTLHDRPSKPYHRSNAYADIVSAQNRPRVGLSGLGVSVESGPAPKADFSCSGCNGR